jgi:hypothetical protein
MPSAQGALPFFSRASGGTLILLRGKLLKKGYTDGNAVGTAAWHFFGMRRTDGNAIGIVVGVR